MELVFDVISGQHGMCGQPASKHFHPVGGSIGRGKDCDWTIDDHGQLLCERHAEISYADGHFYLTDTSRSGIQLYPTGMRLVPGERQRIEHGQVYCLGDLHIRARLLYDPELFAGDIDPGLPAGSVLAADEHPSLDPLPALEPSSDELLARFDLERAIPLDDRPAALDATPPPHVELFWQAFGETLGMRLDHLDSESRRRLALQVARALRQNVDGLLRCLRTRSALNNVLGVAQGSGSPLLQAGNSSALLASLLQPDSNALGEQALRLAYDDLQTHQAALFAASHAALRNLFDQFAPARLVEQFQGSLLGRWRAYRRHYRQLQRDDWNERLLTQDFASAYENQVRLITTLQG
ncbi:type VI secretion system-associated FHA domain protein [Pseudomonas sp. LRF_L74]|uniref:type VI secretion system-associated FHA domain protein n=1 Tax=Pseudomonas sp. LRF_L74 TaxID=3369422 RepID=UPI003F5FC357